MRVCAGSQAAGAERDSQEAAWLATISSHLAAIRQRAAEVLTALHEFRENSTVGWRRGYSSDGLLTEWSAAEDGSLWIRMTGELEDAELAHVVAVAYEVELWPTWVPLCAGAELLQTLGPMERISWTQAPHTRHTRRRCLARRPPAAGAWVAVGGCTRACTHLPMCPACVPRAV